MTFENRFLCSSLICDFLGGLGVIKDTKVVELPIVDSLHPRPPYMPLAIPEDLAPRPHPVTRVPDRMVDWPVPQVPAETSGAAAERHRCQHQ